MPPVPVPLDRPLALNIRPGGEVVLTGTCYLSHDGSTIDAATTHWPKEKPGGASVDPVGLVDHAASGLSLSSRDLEKHEYHYVFGGEASPACRAAGIEGACIVPSTMKLAIDRGIPSAEFLQKLKGAQGCLVAEVPAPTVADVAKPAFPFLAVALGVVGAGTVAFFALRARKRSLESPAGQLLALAKRVQAKVAGADVVTAAPLARAVEIAMRALKGGRVDPSSPEGARVQAVLLRVETALDNKQKQERAEEEKKAADELVAEVESALEAAEEAANIGARTKT
ncbi:MAG: hypothetical protein IPK82_27630 [Polyangiaceae bacterium]|nr:hypothetical protein [Polyangiaceae bacterium]